MSLIFPRAYITSKAEEVGCGCIILMDVDVRTDGNVYITPTITYCPMHTLGPTMIEIIKEGLNNSQIEE